MEFKSLKEHQWKEIKKIYMEAFRKEKGNHFLR